MPDGASALEPEDDPLASAEWVPAMPDPPCGAVVDWQALGLRGPQPPCIKAPGHESGPETDWKRDLHGNGFLRWPVVPS